jgi:hypothetical protein
MEPSDWLSMRLGRLTRNAYGLFTDNQLGSGNLKDREEDVRIILK